MIQIYLAHSSREQIQGKLIENKLKEYVDVYNPFDKENKEYAELHKEIKAGKLSDEAVGDRMTDDFAQWIIDTDLEAIRKSDMLIAICPEKDHPSVGTYMEIFYANRVLNIPVLTYAPDYVKNHPWIIGNSDRVFNNMNNLYAFLVWFLEEQDG